MPDVEIMVTRDATHARGVTSPSGHPDPERFLSELQEDFVLVDYARFVKFIDTSALERGRLFASLVGLSRYSHIRHALDGAKNSRNIDTDLGLSTTVVVGYRLSYAADVSRGGRQLWGLWIGRA
jgi:hypothetical protein